MITRISGTLESVEASAAVLSLPEGVCYEVLLPVHVGDALAGRVGERVTLHTRQYLESVGQGTSFVPRLLGFVTPEDRRFFELFTTVKGLGSRKALRALAEPTPTIAQAIADRDVRSLQRLPEIGKRLAETIVAELHDKVGPFLIGDFDGAEVKPRGVKLSGEAAEAVEALVTLGETRAEAERRVARAIERNGALASADEILAAAVGG